MSLWKRKPQGVHLRADHLDASEVVSAVSAAYAHHNEQGQFIKPRSSLPCSWFCARECFMVVYQMEYLALPKEVHDSYHFIYRELAFFVDDELFAAYSKAVDAAIKCNSDWRHAAGLAADEGFDKLMIASKTVVLEKREEIWARLLKLVPNCSVRDRRLLTETLAYCGAMYRAMYDEWAAFANLVAYRSAQ